MNSEQVKSGIRWFVATFGGVVAGFIAGKGWATADQVMGVLTSDTFAQIAGLLFTVAAGIWGIISKTDRNIVAAANALPDVKGVVTVQTREGRELAASLPNTVAVAGTPEARAIVKTSSGL